MQLFQELTENEKSRSSLQLQVKTPKAGENKTEYIHKHKKQVPTYFKFEKNMTLAK